MYIYTSFIIIKYYRYLCKVMPREIYHTSVQTINRNSDRCIPNREKCYHLNDKLSIMQCCNNCHKSYTVFVTSATPVISASRHLNRRQIQLIYASTSCNYMATVPHIRCIVLCTYLVLVHTKCILNKYIQYEQQCISKCHYVYTQLSSCRIKAQLVSYIQNLHSEEL